MNLQLSGSINASSGNIGNFTITNAQFQQGSGFLDTKSGTGVNYRQASLTSVGLFFRVGETETGVGTEYTGSAITQFSRTSVPNEFNFTFYERDWLYQDSVTNTRDFRVSATRHLYLESGLQNSNGRIYIKSGLTGYTADTLLRVPTTGGALPSTKIIKDNIEDLNTVDIKNLLDNTRIIKYRNKLTNEESYSIIIEDEIEKNNVLIKDLVKRENSLYIFHSYDDIPDFLKPYVNTENFTIETYHEQEKKVVKYYFNPLVFDNVSLGNISISAIQYNHNRIKKLEQEVEELKQLIKNRLGD